MRRTQTQHIQKGFLVKTIKRGLTGLLFCIPFVTSHAQEASYHDHNIYHGAGDAYVNTSAQVQQVGDGGVLRAQLIWNVTPNQTVGADLDLHAKLPDGNGQYLVTQFDPVGTLPYTPQKNPPFGNPNTSATGNQQVNWVNRQVVFSNGQSVASLDQDNRTGIPNSPAGALVENIYIKGTTAANPDNIPSGTYQFAVHNYNQTKLSDPQADYALWITTNGKVGIRSDGHYTGTGIAPVYTGHLQNEGDSSRIYSIDIVNPGHDPHAAGVYVIDGKRAYVTAWKAEQARIAEYRRQQALFAQQQIERSRAAQVVERIDWGNCRPPKVCQTSLYPTSNTLEYVIDPNRAREKLVQNFAPSYKAKTVNADVYQQSITVTNWKEEGWGWFKTSVIDSEYKVTAHSKDEAKQILAVEMQKAQKASNINDGTVNRGNNFFEYGGYVPILGEAISLNQAIYGVDPTTGGKLSTAERALAAYSAIPGIGKTGKGGKIILNLSEGVAKKEAKEVAKKEAKQQVSQALDWSRVNKNGEGAITHVNKHANDIPNRVKPHGVFVDDPVVTTNKAWEKVIKEGIIPSVNSKNQNLIYDVPFPEAGLQGGLPGAAVGNPILNTVRIITTPVGNQVVTAHPF